MAEHEGSTPDFYNCGGVLQTVKEDEESMATPDVHDAGMKIERAGEVYRAYGEYEEAPTKLEVFTWYLYAMCSYFIQAVLIPIVFPLFISEIRFHGYIPNESFKNSRGLTCYLREMDLYNGLTNSTIHVNGSAFSPFEWTSISWGVGLIIAFPVLGFIAKHLDHGHNQQLIAITATAIGAVFCLPSGIFKTKWIFPLYITAIVAAFTVCTAFHTRHLGLMIRGLTGHHPLRKSHFPRRRSIASWLSVHATSAGCLGAAIISTFTYHMLYPSEKFIGLWIVSIFSGLKWLVGISHIFLVNRPAAITSLSFVSPRTPHALSIFKYPYAVGSLLAVFLASFSTMCIFAAAVLHAIGELCLIPKHLLHLWLLYFLVPLLTLPLLQPLQKFLRADAVKMQLLGLLLSVITAGFGFYYQEKNWSGGHIMFFAVLQSTAAGLLHAFGRILVLDCSPCGKEGASSVWYSWVRESGTCLGFAVATAIPGKIGKSLGTAFVMAVAAVLVLIFGNISSFGGAKAAGHFSEESVRGSPVHGLDSTELKNKLSVQVETP